MDEREDHLAWARAYRTTVINRVDTLVPGIERPGLNRTRLHRSVVHDAGHSPGVFAITMTTDGARAIVVSEWTDASAHVKATTDAPGVRRYTLHHSLTKDPRPAHTPRAASPAVRANAATAAVSWPMRHTTPYPSGPRR
ncbi:hypothetical protein [Streptomyces sp. NPDC087300]|uniref:hypothetical protein n=1 Tax=Streptomyces sp. NPDC087300 TaxID=3365780 RepID=UPI00380554D9